MAAHSRTYPRPRVTPPTISSAREGYDLHRFPFPPTSPLGAQMTNPRWRRRIRRLRPQTQVAAPVVIQEAVPVEMRPQIDSRSREAREEILRVVRERFPLREKWPEICVEVIRSSTF
ncbi:hypothetical protein D1007_15789 [Hordeum vulgare]|nr:hypothetical protein D1007_15789 [Hordeum vulgare]